VRRGIRAGSIFMLPLYVWIAVFVGRYHDKPSDGGMVLWAGRVVISAMVVLGAVALVRLLGLAFRSTASHAIFRLAVVNAKGQRADRRTLLRRWSIVWLPLLAPMLLVVLFLRGVEPAATFICALVLLLLWIGAAVYAVIHPNRGLHDRLAGTWVVRR
ncbi:MAG: RDD family protein, partial [Sedimentisphaerales bacterium]|nr:RDD family protein [Sedimentisphaerales bacterium]